MIKIDVSEEVVAAIVAEAGSRIQSLPESSPENMEKIVESIRSERRWFLPGMGLKES